MIDAAAHNAWVLMRSTGSNISLLQFRREIVKTYLTNYKVLPKGPDRTLSASRFSNSSCPVSDAICYDRVDHLIVPTNGERRRANSIVLPIHHLTLYEKQPTYLGAKFRNILPEQVKNAHCEKKLR
ncbi:hypothetical protein J6590_075631 [Homalodisca vitripennis]|nr:hypothetical protein J6590_075631 [Homalodisca vitripennis]